MARLCELEALPWQRRQLKRLARSKDRWEADRARAVLASLERKSSAEIGQMLGVCPAQVRRWRQWFKADGIAGLRAAVRKGREARKAKLALRVVKPLLTGPTRGVWTIARLQAAFAQQTGQTISAEWLRVTLKKRGPIRSPAPATASNTSRTPQPSPKAHKRAIFGVHDVATGEMHIHTSDTKRSTDFIAFLVKLDRLYGPESGNEMPVILVLDNGPIHTSKATTKALAARPWLIIEWLPKYAPELNDIERDWRHLKRHFLANQLFPSPEALDQAIHEAIAHINQQRGGHLWAEQLAAA